MGLKPEPRACICNHLFQQHTPVCELCRCPQYTYREENTVKGRLYRRFQRTSARCTCELYGYCEVCRP